MNNGFGFLMHVIWSIIWPIKGIIYMEEQAIQWIVALTHAWFAIHGASILTIIAIYFVIMFVVFERGPHRMHHGGLLQRVLRFIGSMFIVICFAWFFLIYGVLCGEREGNRGEEEATVEYHYHNHPTRNFGMIYRIRRISLHFRLGRAIYRFFYRVLGYIPFIARNAALRQIAARSLGLVVVLWGVWHIPYDLTH